MQNFYEGMAPQTTDLPQVPEGVVVLPSNIEEGSPSYYINVTPKTSKFAVI
jgi:hypothetical protein